MAVSKQKMNTFFNNRSKPNIASLISATPSKKQKEEIPVLPQSGINTDLKQKEIKEKSGPNQAQTRPKLGPNQAQTRPTEKKRSTQIRPKPGPNQAQIRPKLGPENQPSISFYKLTGLQRKAVIFIYNECKEFRAEISRPITLALFAENIETTKNAAKRAIERLEKKGGIIRHSFQIGRGGWTKYKLPNFIYNEVINYENTSGVTLLCKDNVQKSGPNLYTSSSNINTTTELANEWKNIKIEGLIEHGFNDNHIQQIAKLGILAPDDLQQSIDYFVFDLLENNKASEIKKSPVAFFMGILRGKGLYTAPLNYESVKDRVLRLKTEQLKQQQEKREKMEAELIQTEFKIWESGITVEEKEKLMPEEVKNSRFSAEKEGFFRTYFKEKFWPAIQQEKYADCF